MAWDYDKLNKKTEENWWTSYSDLFMMLSVVFLLMYVVASLRSQTEGLGRIIENKKLAMEVQDLKEQTRVYTAMKEDYLEKNASEDERKTYDQLMDKLKLLQTEASEEKRKLRAQAEENEQKEMALNHYQRIIRNIINANVMAKAGIKHRDEKITQRTKQLKETSEVLRTTSAELTEKSEALVVSEKELAAKNREVETLQSDISEKRKQIEKNNQAIASAQTELERRIRELRATKQSESSLNKKISALTQEAERQVASLKAENDKANSTLKDRTRQLVEASENLKNTNEALTQTRQDLSSREAQLATKNQELSRLQGDIAEKKRQIDANNRAIAAANAELAGKIRELKGTQQGQSALAKKIAQLTKESDAKIAGLRAENEKASDALRKQGSRVASLEGALKQAEDKSQKYAEYAATLNKEKDDLAKDLAKSKSLIDAKRKLAADIRKALQNAGVNSEVNGESGDVVINFGNEYFDTSKANLKPGMVKAIEKFFPAYSRSLLGNPKLAEKVSSVEIVGFSSPTYKGKFVDPASLTDEDRAAVNYNLDLSYRRARSIFQHVTDQNRFSFQHQKSLLPLMKVTGRSYLSEDVKGRGLGNGISTEEFCKKFDCLKSQRVIVRFELKD